MGLLERVGKAMGTWPTETHNIDKMALWGSGQDIGDPVHAGVYVSQESALKLTAVWRCIRLISETIAALPVEAVRKRDEIREPVDRPPAWLSAPNPDTTWFEFHERVVESLLMDGNAFVLIAGRNELGFASELWTLHPRQIDVRSRNGRVYFLWEGSTELSRFGPTNPTGDVLHIRLATAGAARGMSPLEQAKQAIGLGLVAEKFGAKFFGQGQTMSGVIQLPASTPALSQEHIKVMRETWEAAHSGSDVSHRPGILTGGATWQGITIPPEQAQFLETRKFQVEDVARIYGVPAHLIGLEEKNTSWGTGIEAQTTGFLRFTLLPHIVRLETAFSQLLPRGQFINLDTKAFLRADKKTEADVLQTELQNGVISFNDWRAILDLPPRRGGDSYMVPLNMQIIPASGVVPTPSPNGQQPVEVTR
jgi:HK97 family phage portal protein